MKSAFSTADVRPRQRFAYWHDVACRKIIGFEATPRNRLKFGATIQAAKLAAVDLIVFENSPMDAAVTAGNIAQARTDCLLVCRQLRGGVKLDQDGRQTVLRAGEFTVIDPRRPYTAVYDVQSEMLVMKVARRELEQRCERTAELSGRIVQRDGGIGAFTSDHLALLPAYAAGLNPAAAVTAASHALDLIALSLLGLLDGDGGRPSPRSLAASNLRAVIERRLDDPELDPASAAADAGISLRYAQSLLAEQGTSVARLIQARRLEQCERTLANPLQSHRTVSDIAFGWGFADLTHFGRLFKKRFGATPSDYRRQLGEHAARRDKKQSPARLSRAKRNRGP